MVAIEGHNPAMTLVQATLGYHDLNHDGVANTGDTLDFSYTVHNTGNVTLTEIGVTDPDGVVSITIAQIAALAPGASDNTTFSGLYTITALDVSNGYHDNEAVASSLETNAVTGTVHVLLTGLTML
jgi:uncharacterized repeat protein (TIGR01451 family)